jgi:hypothetical protein|nr:MAG TPA: hypothetical protein [Caudoviricetes sp.]
MEKIDLFTSSNIISTRAKMDFNYRFYVSIMGIKISDKQVLSYVNDRDFENYMYPKRVLSVLLFAKDYYEILSKVTPDKPFVPVTMQIKITPVQKELGTQVTASFLTGEYTGMIDKTRVSEDILVESKPNAKSHVSLGNLYRLNIALFDFDDLNFAKEGTISGNFGSGKKVEDLIKHAFNVCKGKNKCKLMLAKPDNKNPLKNCIISSQGFLDFLKFIDTEYGVYTSKYHVYLENGTCYILNPEKTDTGMNKEIEGTFDDKIDIQVFRNVNYPVNLYGISLKDDHYSYSVFGNNLVETDISVGAMMRPIELTINSNGAISKSKESEKKKETISPTVKVNAGRTRGVTKENRNPKFQAKIILDDVPVHVMPYTVVHYMADLQGDCMVSRVTNIFTKGKCVTELYIKSYEPLLEYKVPDSQKGASPDKTANQQQ